MTEPVRRLNLAAAILFALLALGALALLFTGCTR